MSFSSVFFAFEPRSRYPIHSNMPLLNASFCQGALAQIYVRSQPYGGPPAWHVLFACLILDLQTLHMRKKLVAVGGSDKSNNGTGLR